MKTLSHRDLLTSVLPQEGGKLLGNNIAPSDSVNISSSKKNKYNGSDRFIGNKINKLVISQLKIMLELKLCKS